MESKRSGINGKPLAIKREGVSIYFEFWFETRTTRNTKPEIINTSVTSLAILMLNLS